MHVERLIDRPIIDPSSHVSLGENIQGPSLIRVPDWVPDPLGRYYLYFADHKGRYIRLAFADDLAGPWQIHVPGSLQLEDTPFPKETLQATRQQVEAAEERNRAAGVKLLHSVELEMTTPHIASPDVHVDEKNRRLVMYYHGLEGVGRQVTRVATSPDGITFESAEEILGRTYMRVFVHDERTYGLAMPGLIYRAATPTSGFEEGPLLFNRHMRHAAVLVRAERAHVFWTQVGDAPERILLSTIDLSDDWTNWRESEPVEVLRPERVWEGAGAPVEPSVRSVAYGVVNQLRDPAIFEEEGRIYLVYAIGGEAGLGIAKVEL